ncbi:MAG: DNA adenine methylase [bacterium]|nr:DNA adenine methylase [bacterium]
MQLPLFQNAIARFPSTRYQGSKAKLTDWIWEQIKDLAFKSALDAFGGTGAVAYRLKQEGKQVFYNDVLRFNALIGKALIENQSTRLDSATVEDLLNQHEGITYPDFIQRTFPDIYYTDAENAWIDQTITNIYRLEHPEQFALAVFALCQACIIKRPYNLFHRKNLYVRLAEVERSFGNKTTWDKPFETWFRFFVDEANQAVFDNGQQNRSYNMDALDFPESVDLIYIDPPYISRQGVAVDYRDFYHFLEGLTFYSDWEAQVDFASKHRRLLRQQSPWTDKNQIADAFDRLFARFRESIIVVSYRSDGIPGESALVHLLEKYKSHVRVVPYGHYKYVLSKNARSGELLLIGT